MISDKLKNSELLEAGFTIKCNDQYHKIVSRIKEEVGSIDSDRVYFEWNEWLKKAVKRQNEEDNDKN